MPPPSEAALRYAVIDCCPTRNIQVIGEEYYENTNPLRKMLQLRLARTYTLFSTKNLTVLESQKKNQTE